MIFKNKDQVRNHIWDLMVQRKIAIFPLPPHGRIPNFAGAKESARNLRRHPLYQRANCIFCGPDSTLKPLRDQVLRDGKILAYATPHMRAFKSIKALRPVGMIKPSAFKIDTTIKGLMNSGEELKEKVDIAIIGSVAVDLNGNRLGKGSGYGDREIDYLKENNLIQQKFSLGTLVHSIQIVPDLSPFIQPYDIPVDFILTEKEIIFCKPT